MDDLSVMGFEICGISSVFSPPFSTFCVQHSLALQPRHLLSAEQLWSWDLLNRHRYLSGYFFFFFLTQPLSLIYFISSFDKKATPRTEWRLDESVMCSGSQLINSYIIKVKMTSDVGTKCTDLTETLYHWHLQYLQKGKQDMFETMWGNLLFVVRY